VHSSSVDENGWGRTHATYFTGNPPYSISPYSSLVEAVNRQRNSRRGTGADCDVQVDQADPSSQSHSSDVCLLARQV
jgi:hypothetical protein